MTSIDSGVAPGLGPRLTGLVDSLFGFDVQITAAESSAGAGSCDASAECGTDSVRSV